MINILFVFETNSDVQIIFMSKQSEAVKYLCSKLWPNSSNCFNPGMLQTALERKVKVNSLFKIGHLTWLMGISYGT